MLLVVVSTARRPRSTLTALLPKFIGPGDLTLAPARLVPDPILRVSAYMLLILRTCVNVVYNMNAHRTPWVRYTHAIRANLWNMTFMMLELQIHPFHSLVTSGTLPDVMTR